MTGSSWLPACGPLRTCRTMKACLCGMLRALKRLLWSHGGGDNKKDDPADKHYNNSADDHTSTQTNKTLHPHPPRSHLSRLFVARPSRWRSPDAGTSDEVLHSFSQIVTPAVTSPHPAVQEEGINCLGKFTLLSGVVDSFHAVLRRVGAGVARRNAVLARAIMALCLETTPSTARPRRVACC